jgi:hypothetical protein
VHINGAGSPAAPCNCAPSRWPPTGVSSTVAFDDPCVSAVPHGIACAAVGGHRRGCTSCRRRPPHGTLETIVEANYCRSMMTLLTFCKRERACRRSQREVVAAVSDPGRRWWCRRERARHAPQPQAAEDTVYMAGGVDRREGHTTCIGNRLIELGGRLGAELAGRARSGRGCGPSRTGLLRRLHAGGARPPHVVMPRDSGH